MKSTGRKAEFLAMIAGIAVIVILFTPMLRTLGPFPGGNGVLFAKDEKGAAREDQTAKEQKDSKDKGKDEQGGEKENGKENEESPCPECPECPDPAKVVLAGLEDKKKAVAKAEEELKQEKKKLESFKEELDEKLMRLARLKEQIDADFARLEKKKTDKELKQEAAFETKMQKLVKIYAGMKPKKAGAIINEMDIMVARQIFSRMRKRSAANILSYVNSEKAAKIGEFIAYKKK